MRPLQLIEDNMKNWNVLEPNVRLQQSISSAVGLSPLFAQLLVNRGIRTPGDAEEFLFGDISSCHDPYLMKDMEKSVLRIIEAVNKKEKILIYGDYDVDGVTSTALLSYTMMKIGADFSSFIPHRQDDGYGLNIDAIKRFKENRGKLIITVDCGISAIEEVKFANELAIDIIITDHHEINGDRLPAAYSIINTHQTDCEYPFKGLAGVGMAYKLARALLPGRENEIDEHLDLVALGTVADIAPVVGENRILTKLGLRKMQSAPKTGLKALMDVAGVDPEKITCRHIGFMLGPRINAIGRVGSARIAVELLLTDDADEAVRIADELNRENKNRQSIEKELQKEASIQASEFVNAGDIKTLVLSGDNWHPGVLGIVASRISDEYGVPTIMISFDGDKGKGSGRTVGKINLFEAITKAGDNLTDFGGHEAACGIKIQRPALEKFRKEFNEAVKNKYSDISDFTPGLDVDVVVPFSHIGKKLLKELELLMPFGTGNREPVFLTRDIKVKSSPRDIGKNGFKFFAICGTLTCEAITFRKNKFTRPRQNSIVDLAFTPSINTWKGMDTVQLNIRDMDIRS
jgi:single-stranded-DNA-specific exonuclease